MDKKEFESELPSAAGSPFKTKNFNKFFFGILIATLILLVLIVAYFLLGFGKHAQTHPVSRVGTPAVHSQPSEGKQRS